MYDIFLSYSTKDRDRLQPLFGALEERGWSVFWDHRTIDIGDHWSKKINQAIRTSKCVLVVWSENSIESEWVLEEANIGKQRDVFLPIRIDDVILPVGFTMRQTGDFVDWKDDVNDPQFIRLTEKIQELVERHHVEQTRLAKEKAAADQKAREVAERQRWLEESQARLAAEEAAKQKKLEQQRATEQKAREEAERQAKAQQAQIQREQTAAEEKARKEATRQAKLNQGDKKFPLIPALLLSTAVLGGGSYYWQISGKSPVEVSPAGDSSMQQINFLQKESLAGQSPTTSSTPIEAAVVEPPTVATPQPAVVEPAPSVPTPEAQLQQTETWLGSTDKIQWAKAIEVLNPLADSGNSAAMRQLGVAYYLGRGVKKSHSKGCSWYKQAADAGHEKAKETYAKLCR